MSIVVQKYGGSSLSSPEKIKKIADQIVLRKKDGNKIVVIASAMGDTTNNLLNLATQVNNTPSKRELDMLLTTGEQISVSLLAMAIENLGFDSVSLNSFQSGIETTGYYAKSKISEINTTRINKELDKNKIVIITGFQGYNKEFDLTTLGRGGSDTTAVAIAIALNAKLCEIYTDVDGIYTADPRFIKNAKRHNTISYDEMLELSRLGASVMHARSIELARKYNMIIKVSSSLDNTSSGTMIGGFNVEKVCLRGLSVDHQIAKISVIGVPDKPGIAHLLFYEIHKNNISIDMIIQNVNYNGLNDITFTVSENDLNEANLLLKSLSQSLNYKEIKWDKDVSKLSIVGTGIMGQGEIAAKFFKILSDLSINVDMISTSDIKLSVILDKSKSIDALEALHLGFSNDFYTD